MNKVLAFIVTLIIATGCASNLPKEGSATLQNQRVDSNGKLYSLVFDALDGKPLKVGAFTKPNKATHYVKPGKKDVQLKVTRYLESGNGVYGAIFIGKINFKLNSTYKMRVSEVGTCITVFVESDSGETVFGPVKQPLYIIGSPEFLLVELGYSDRISKPSSACDV
jgi:hypothetical protein